MPFLTKQERSTLQRQSLITNAETQMVIAGHEPTRLEATSPTAHKLTCRVCGLSLHLNESATAYDLFPVSQCEGPNQGQQDADWQVELTQLLSDNGLKLSESGHCVIWMRPAGSESF